MVYTDEWRSYAHLPERGRGHATVCLTLGEWARDDDGDGIREVHDNTLEGTWTGAEKRPADLMEFQRKVLAPVCGYFRVVLQREAGNLGIPANADGRPASR